VVVFSEGGSRRVWDLTSGAELAELRGHQHPVTIASFSSDGGSVVTGSDDGAARVWDAVGGTELAELRGHQGEVDAISGTELAVMVFDASPTAFDIRVDMLALDDALGRLYVFDFR
jgi:WD40 repeat protein